jgi:hypothetical protein
MIELRFLIRNGERVLQYRLRYDWSYWQDVPEVLE